LTQSLILVRRLTPTKARLEAGEPSRLGEETDPYAVRRGCLGRVVRLSSTFTFACIGRQEVHASAVVSTGCVSRSRFLYVYLPCVLIVWGASQAAGVKSGTVGSLAIIWGGGLLLALVVFFLLSRL